ncbi:MAG: trypsin-like peptidase domain-containing protein, partial [Clostridia bacterium]|nr:trypsin-like peptidase domain-containing protein [Clostridia bacterium]
NYYEQPDFYGSPQPPKKRGGVVVAVIVTGIVCMLLGALIASFLLPKFANWPSPTPGEEVVAPEQSERPDWLPDWEETTPPEVQETPVPTPAVTPAPTTRPIPEFDGQSPALPGGYVNPLPDIVEACAPSVVGVSVYARDKVYDHMQMFGGGSGFVITSDGYIVTNAHVVEGAEMVEVTFSDGTAMEAELIGADYTTDIAVIKVDGKDLAALKLGDSSTLRVGEFAIAIGDPTGQELAGTTTFGIISALEREVNLDGQTNEYIQTDAAINPGNSGGPLLNMSGEVIGITSAKTVTAGYDEYGNDISAEGLGFAIPISDAMPIVEELIAHGRIQRPGVGISIVTPSEMERELLEIPEGVVVYSVTKDGPAHRAGLKKYDVITACNGITAAENDAFVDLVQQMKVGEEAVFTVWRDGETLEITVTIGDLNEIGSELVEFKIDERYGW